MAEIRSVIARESDGNLQITFTIPFAVIKKAQDETIAEMAHDIEVPGFRKGKAPLDKVREKISKEHLIEHSLSHVLPKALSNAIKEHNLKIAIYPKYELISVKDGEDWQIRAVTCELPEIVLGGYKQSLASFAGKTKIAKEPKREEKEQVVIKYLVENIKFDIPKILIEEEVNSRLTSLLSRIEKLGLALESYLSSIGKTPESIRKEYKDQAKSAIALDLILSKIAQEEGIEVDEKEVEEALKVSQAKPESHDIIKSVLRKRKALEFLTNLV